MVDSIIGQTGGVGLNDRMKNWRDTHVRVVGPVVSAMSAAFEGMLQIAKNRKFSAFSTVTNRSHDFQFITSSPILRPVSSLFKESWSLRDVYLDAIRGAQKFAYLTTPYFVPDLRFFRALRLAAKRGVDVRLLLPATSDHRSLDIANASYFGLALKFGIKIYKFREAVLHAKTAVVDDEWATVGSANLDNLSFRFNYEANVVSNSLTFNKELKESFLNDLKKSDEVTLDNWKRRPLKDKILELIIWPIHSIM